jgi:hypothetical protein
MRKQIDLLSCGNRKAERCFFSRRNNEPGLLTLSVIRLEEVAEISSDGEKLSVTDEIFTIFGVY